MLTTSHGWGISARAHVHTALLDLRNGLTDCVQIWYVGWASLSTRFPQVRGGVGHLCTCARAPPSPYFRIRVANCAKIWCVAGDPIVTRFTRVGGGVTAHLHVRLQFRCLGNRWALTLKPHQKQTYLSLSHSLVHRQTWRLTGLICPSKDDWAILDPNEQWSTRYSLRHFREVMRQAFLWCPITCSRMILVLTRKNINRGTRNETRNLLAIYTCMYVYKVSIVLVTWQNLLPSEICIFDLKSNDPWAIFIA